MMSECDVIKYQRRLLVALASLEHQVIETEAKLIVISVIMGGGE